MKVHKSCKVINICQKTGHRDEVYIGRDSEWGNPYKIDSNNDRAAVIANQFTF